MANFCSNCGNPLNGNKFCTECGLKAETRAEVRTPVPVQNTIDEVQSDTVENTYTNPSVPMKRKSKNWIKWVVISGVATVLAVVVFLIIASSNFKIRFMEYADKEGVRVEEQYIEITATQDRLYPEKETRYGDTKYIREVAENLNIPDKIINNLWREPPGLGYNEYNVQETDDVRIRSRHYYDLKRGYIVEVIFELKDKSAD
ncbi:MAG: zinc ribbon domain-containing protein [Clostridia bacterium]|nr:zinc ribbon domain-containing protein [Clostridia bacterium]